MSIGQRSGWLSLSFDAHPTVIRAFPIRYNN